MIATCLRTTALVAPRALRGSSTRLTGRTFSSSTTSRNEKGDILKVTGDTFEKEVTRSAKPVLVDFTATWCMPCRMLGPVLDKAVKEDGRVRLVQIDVDEQVVLAGDYGISSLPTVVAFHKGAPVDSFIGAKNASSVQEFINGVIHKTSKDPQ
ncbi:hypothetical protein GGI11_000554 [Coemansia sp. RSA 2049]|nr:hypothetical protein GGI11_000554 [Coemansia sp. RSA 2049]